MATKNKLLSILSDAEQEALYGLPDFDDAQRLEFLAMDESELTLACSRRGLHAQMYCIIQIAYFKAKHLFFRFGWDDVPDDCSFVLSRYFPGRLFLTNCPISTNAILSGKKSARCMVTTRGHRHCLHSLNNRRPTLFTAMSLPVFSPLS